MKLGYVILYVPNVLATVDFYERAFALKRRFVHESQQYAEMETGGTALAFVDETFVRESIPNFAGNAPTAPPAGIEVALTTENVQAAYDAALRAGATAQLAPKQKPWGQTVSYVRDLNGCLVEICSPMSG
jgi:lactoylglutathione lyase